MWLEGTRNRGGNDFYRGRVKFYLLEINFWDAGEEIEISGKIKSFVGEVWNFNFHVISFWGTMFNFFAICVCLMWWRLPESKELSSWVFIFWSYYCILGAFCRVYIIRCRCWHKHNKSTFLMIGKSWKLILLDWRCIKYV